MDVSIDPHRVVVVLAMTDRFSANTVIALNEFVAANRTLAYSHIRPKAVFDQPRFITG